jgi:hypothetical protein
MDFSAPFGELEVHGSAIRTLQLEGDLAHGVALATRLEVRVKRDVRRRSRRGWF